MSGPRFPGEKTMAEKILLGIALTVLAVLMADVAYEQPLRYWAFMECHVWWGKDVCSFSWRKFVMMICNYGLALIFVACLCNHENLRKRRHVA